MKVFSQVVGPGAHARWREERSVELSSLYSVLAPVLPVVSWFST